MLSQTVPHASAASRSPAGCQELRRIHREIRRRGRNIQGVWDLLQHPETQVAYPSRPSITTPSLLMCALPIISSHPWIPCFLLHPHRHEFDSEQIPDLTKDVFRQDIHSVGSLCKLYFRELPNPLLTYQLYDRFSVRTGAGTGNWGRREMVNKRSRLSWRAEGMGGMRGNAHLHGSNYIFESSYKLGHCIVWSSLAAAGEAHAETRPSSAAAALNAKRVK